MEYIDRKAYELIKKRSHREHKDFNFSFCLILSYCEAYYEIYEVYKELIKRQIRLYNVENALENGLAELFNKLQEILNIEFGEVNARSILNYYADDHHINF